MKSGLVLIVLGSLAAAPFENRVIPQAMVTECSVGNLMYREIKNGFSDDLEIYQENGPLIPFLLDRFSLIPEHDEVYGVRNDDLKAFGNCVKVPVSKTPGCVLKDRFFVKEDNSMHIYSLNGGISRLLDSFSLDSTKDEVHGDRTDVLETYGRLCK